MNTIIPVITSCVAVLLVTPLIRAIAVRFNIVDNPDHRKQHKSPVPLLGGVAIFAGLFTGHLFNLTSFQYFFPLIAGGGIIFVMGLADDMKGLSCRVRLVGQLAAALIIICSGNRIEFLPNNMMGVTGEVILTIIWIVGITNAMNYLDGLDGLASGITAISSLCFAVVAYMTGQDLICMLSLILTASCAGFIPHNFKQEKMFLGDAGSTLMGFILASIAVTGHWASDNVIRLSVPVLILGVPIFDMTFTSIMRVKEKKVSTVMEWLKYAGKDHFHHRLIDVGFDSVRSVFLIYCVTFYMGISAVIISYALNPLEAVKAVIHGGIIFGVIGILMVEGHHASQWLKLNRLKNSFSVLKYK